MSRRRRCIRYRAECGLCQYAGPQRETLYAAWAEQERHADSRAHILKIAERDRPLSGEPSEHG